MNDRIIRNFCLIILFLPLLWPFSLSAQDMNVPLPEPRLISAEGLRFGVEMRAAGGTSGETPFWLHSNRNGEFDRYSNNALINLFGSWQHTFSPGISLEAGADLLFQGSADSDIRFQEAYVRMSYRSLYVRAGRQREHFGMLNRTLTMGSVDLSYNARPMPKIAAGTEGWIALPGTSGLIYADAGIAHGWMDDNYYRHVKDPWLHQKHLYLRIFSEDAPVAPIGGITHFAQWGGTHPTFGELPRGLMDYRDVFFSLTPNAKEIFEGGQLLNQFQNHVGAYDFALLLNFERYRVKLSRQFILEDTPNARFGAPFDGMWGATVELRSSTRRSWRGGSGVGETAGRSASGTSVGGERPFLRAVHYSYLDTKEGISRYDHRDETSYFNYYGHSTYRGGWTYYGRAIGNPLFFSDPDYISVVNNIVIAHHVGAMGHWGAADWRLFTTYSRNYGASGYRPREGVTPVRNNNRRDQWSFLLETRMPMPGFRSGSGTSAQTNAGAAYSATNGDNGAVSPQRNRPGSAHDRSRAFDLDLGLALALDAGSIYDTNIGLLVSVRMVFLR